jgi:hypothetical protein
MAPASSPSAALSAAPRWPRPASASAPTDASSSNSRRGGAMAPRICSSSRSSAWRHSRPSSPGPRLPWFCITASSPRTLAGARRSSATAARPLTSTRTLAASPRAAGTTRAGTGAASRRRGFDLAVLACPRCGGRRRVIATVQDPLAVQAILAHLGPSLSPEAPGPTPPRPRAGRLVARPDPSRRHSRRGPQPQRSACSLPTPAPRRRMARRQRAITVPALAFAPTTRPGPGPAPGSAGETQAGRTPAAPAEVAEVALIVPRRSPARDTAPFHGALEYTGSKLETA